MDMKNKQKFFLVFLIVLLFALNYSFIDNALEQFFLDYETAVVERVIDGDTIVIENSTSVRLLGINTPEKGDFYYQEAKEFLNELVLNQTIRLEFGKEKYDRYHRILAYVYFEGKNVNLELVEKGFANFYFPSGKDMYYNDFAKAWESCVEKNVNFCEKSIHKCADCIGLKEFDYKNEIVIFENKCGVDCELTDWTIKDEGRKNFVFPEFVLENKKEVKIIVCDGEDSELTLFWNNEDYVWTRTGDSLFVRDEKGKLVLSRSY